MFEPIKIRAKAALLWAGDESHRRAVAGVIAAAIAYLLGQQIDSTIVDAALIVVLPAMLSMWSSHTPNLEGGE